MKTFFLFSKEESETKVANDRLLSHAVGLAGQNMTYSFLTGRLFVYLNTLLGIPSEKTGIITGISSLWDAINDPLIGSLMDHRRYKPGYKMRPFLLWTPPIIGILVALMFIDFGLSETQTVIFILVLYLLYDAFYSFHDIAIWGMTALTSPSSEERKRVAQWLTIGAGAGSTIAGLFPMLKDVISGSGVMSEKNTYLLFAMVFGFGGMLLAMLAYRQKEKVIEAPPKKGEKKNILRSILNLRHNRTLIVICLARVVQSFSLTLPWEYFFESDGVSYEVFGATITGGTAQVVYGFVMGIPGAIFMLAAVPTINKLGGNKNLLVFSELASVVARILAFLIGANERYKNIWVLLVVIMILGSAQILTNMKDIAHRSLLTNSIDEMELKTGERTEGITFSMQNLVSKLTNAIPKFLQGYLLKFLGFNEKLGTGGSDTIRKQTSARFLKYRWHQFILGPAIGAALYVIVILFLEKDDKENMAEIERQLKALRANAADGMVDDVTADV